MHTILYNNDIRVYIPIDLTEPTWQSEKQNVCGFIRRRMAAFTVCIGLITLHGKAKSRKHYCRLKTTQFVKHNFLWTIQFLKINRETKFCRDEKAFFHCWMRSFCDAFLSECIVLQNLRLCRWTLNTNSFAVGAMTTKERLATHGNYNF